MYKLTSRKLWVALVGVVTGISMFVNGDKTEGTATVISSVLGYLLSEGIIDAKSINTGADILGNTVEMLNGGDNDENH